jgi:DNA-directed RNA polymerase subunit RPC12/RpoP
MGRAALAGAWSRARLHPTDRVVNQSRGIGEPSPLSATWASLTRTARIHIGKETSMPQYEYVCRNCHKKFSEVLTIKEHDTKKSPVHEVQALRRRACD